MDAKEAREKAKQYNISISNNQYTEIKGEIDLAVSAGKYNMYYYTPIKTDVKKTLVNEGYVLSNETNYRNEYTIQISW